VKSVCVCTGLKNGFWFAEISYGLCLRLCCEKCMLNRLREGFGMLTCWVYASLIPGNTKGDVKITRRKNLEFGLTQMFLLLCREAEGLSH
jgi:hypothetical protein